MKRYIDAHKIPYHDLSDGKGLCQVAFLEDVIKVPTADVRKNIRAVKVMHEQGMTHFYTCGLCGNEIDIEDAYCKHCGAVLEINHA